MAVTQEQREGIIRLASEGKTTGEISKILDIKETAVRYCKRSIVHTGVVVDVVVDPPEVEWWSSVPNYCVVSYLLEDGVRVRITRAICYKNRHDSNLLCEGFKIDIGKEVKYSIRKFKGKTYHHLKPG